MTAIAYRDGIMAADTLCTFEDSDKKTLNSVKIIQRDGYLIGVAGAKCPGMDQISDWYFGECQPWTDSGTDFDLLIVKPDGTIWEIDERASPEQIHEPFWAIGVAEGALLCLMERGATAIEAVETAIKWIDGCGGRVSSAIRG